MYVYRGVIRREDLWLINEGAAELLPTVELDLKRRSAKAMEKAKQLCSQVYIYLERM